jgi:PAS domain S-box-containing protein
VRDYSPIEAVSELLMDVPEFVFVYGTDGRYLFVNRQAADFLGVEPLDVVGYHWRDLGYPEDIMEPLLARVLAVAASGVPDRYRLTSSPQRGSLELDFSFTPLRGDGPEVFGVLAIGHDITAYVR